MEILTYPNEMLRKVCDPVTKVDAELTSQIDDMFEILAQTDHGVGLAAPQVGIPMRFFVMDLSDPGWNEDGLPMQVFINPVLSGHKKWFAGKEGCLSLPGAGGPVMRATRVHIEAYDADGNHIDKVFTDMKARIVQHEVDHLDGILFIDKIQGRKEKKKHKRKPRGPKGRRRFQGDRFM